MGSLDGETNALGMLSGQRSGVAVVAVVVADDEDDGCKSGEREGESYSWELNSRGTEGGG